MREVILQATINREWLLVPNIIAPHDNEVQQYVHNQVQPEVQVRIADLHRVQDLRIKSRLHKVGVIVLRPEVVIVRLQEAVQVIVDHQDQVRLVEVTQAEVPAGVPVGVPAGVVERNNY